MTDNGLTLTELLAERAIALPDKEVVSVIDVNADIDLNINAASPIDLAAAANLNVAAPIQAAAGANVLAYGSDSTATATHADTGVVLTQYLGADANATSTQDSNIDQTDNTTTGGTTGDTGGTGGTTGDTGTGGTGGTTGDTGTGGTTTGSVGTGGLMSGSLLNVNVNVHLDTDLAAPIGGAAAVNGNVAAPISAAVGANIGAINSTATALSVQDAVVDQQLEGSANATQNQVSTISQGTDTTTTGVTGGTTTTAGIAGPTTSSLGSATGGAGAAGSAGSASSTGTTSR